MELAKLAVEYYVQVTGNSWNTFFEKLDEALSGSLENQTGDLWLIHSLVNTIQNNGLSLEDFKTNKDVIKSVFDNEDKKNAGEFFTPMIWAEELHKYMDKHIPNWRTEYNIWEPSAGTGNLIKTANINVENLFASTLQSEDVELLKNTDGVKGATVFQLDFLNSCDDGISNFFTSQLPEKLQDVIYNNKPLIFLCNPPYKSGASALTGVGKVMSNKAGIDTFDYTDFSKPSYDLFYQFCYQMMNLVAQFNLKNVYICIFGPLWWFTGASPYILTDKFEHCFEFLDGMCISAQEFSATSDSIEWGIGATVWKSRGGYFSKPEELGLKSFHKDILLDKKFIAPDGTIGCEGRVLYAPPRERLADWCKPVTNSYKTMPVMTSHSTFKGSEMYELVAEKTAKVTSDSLGILMCGNTLARESNKCAILSGPSTIEYVSITEENFWRCVASFAFRRTYVSNWAVTKKDLSAPDTSVKGYEEWLINSLPLFLFEYKSMQSAHRNIKWNGLDNYCIHNKLFYLTEDEIRSACHDEVVLQDLETYGLHNQFLTNILKEYESRFAPEVKALYDWCKSYTLATYDCRKQVGYKNSMQCCDAGFQQLRANIWDMKKLEPDLTKLVAQARDFLRKDLNMFGFITEFSDSEE